MPNVEIPNSPNHNSLWRGRGGKESQVLGKALECLAAYRTAASCRAEQKHGGLLRRSFERVSRGGYCVPMAFRKLMESSAPLHVFSLIWLHEIALVQCCLSFMCIARDLKNIHISSGDDELSFVRLYLWDLKCLQITALWVAVHSVVPHEVLFLSLRI